MPTSDGAPDRQPARELPPLDLPLPGTPSCPRRTAHLPGIGGRIGSDCADFVVDEIPAYAPSGEGDHWFIHLRKTDIGTPQARRLLARAAGVDARDIGFAGRKDRRAVSTQWMSLPARHGDTAPPIEPIDGVEILEVARHGHKLRLGHLTANRFSIRLFDLHPDALDRLPALAEGVRAGVPDYYGPQRFGAAGRALRQALGFAARPKRRVRDPKFLASVLQSAVFNAWLGDRMADGLIDTAVEGDVLRKRQTGGLFVCADAVVDGPRVAAGEVDPCGPMPGRKMKPADGPARAREAAAAGRFGVDLTLGPLSRFAPGTRRPARLVPRDLTWRPEAGGALVVSFTLRPGSYATTVLGELMGAPDARDGVPGAAGEPAGR